MPVGEIAGELLGGIFKLIGRIFGEIIFEILLKGVGYLICRIFYKRVDPDGIVVALVGFIFWGILGLGIYLLYEFILLQLAIDCCLDAGGRFNYDVEICEYSSNT